MMGALKAYASTLAFLATICLPVCFWALQNGKIEMITGRQSLRLIIVCHFVASAISKNMVFGRLGSKNVSSMTTARTWMSPCESSCFHSDMTRTHSPLVNAFCVLKSLFSDPGNTSFKVSGTFASPTEERYPNRRKPLLDRMSSPIMIGYAAVFLLASWTMLSFATSVAHQHLVVDGARGYMHTGAALRMLDVIFGVLVPLRYMISPPSLPNRRELLVEDEHGVLRSRKKAWTKRDGASKSKLLLQVAIIALFDWL